ncbi:MAG: hypothetical protein K5750_00040 [Eubacterium sp.]|nr:hypothetical protein [Eubacterium sp.]
MAEEQGNFDAESFNGMNPEGFYYVGYYSDEIEDPSKYTQYDLDERSLTVINKLINMH